MAKSQFVLALMTLLCLNVSLAQSPGVSEQDLKPGASPEWSVGRANAPVSLEVFNDYQCPPCAIFNEELKNIEATYKGNVRIVFRNFPLTVTHVNALLAAQAAEAAGLQGRFAKMINLLYNGRRRWAESRNARQHFISYARRLHLDRRRFTGDIDGAEVRERIRLDVERAHSLGVLGTPTVFVNGKMLSMQTDLNQAIKAALSGSSMK